MSASPPPSPAPRKLPVHSHPPRPLSLWQDSQHDQGEVKIEIIPLIDVIFCILTFFILGAVGLSRQQAISLDLPKASTGTPQMREMFVVSLDDLGQLYVEKQPVNEAQMMNALQNYHQYNPNGLIVLHASRNTSYNDVVQLLDSLRSVGGDKVALATLPGENNASGLPSNDANPPSLGLPGSPSSPFGSTLPDAFSTPSFNTPLPGVPNLNNGGGSGLSPNFASPRFSPGSTIPQAPGTSQAPPSANAP